MSFYTGLSTWGTNNLLINVMEHHQPILNEFIKISNVFSSIYIKRKSDNISGLAILIVERCMSKQIRITL